MGFAPVWVTPKLGVPKTCWVCTLNLLPVPKDLNTYGVSIQSRRASFSKVSRKPLEA